MKTAEEISQKWVGWEFNGAHLEKRKQLEAEIKDYARHVTMDYLIELDNTFCDEYNLSTDPDIKTP